MTSWFSFGEALVWGWRGGSERKREKRRERKRREKRRERKRREKRRERKRTLKVQSVLNDQSTEVSHMIKLTNQNTEM